jgi:four helix bundle protein
MPTQADFLRNRVKQFAVRLIRFGRSIARDPVVDSLIRQLVRSGTGVSGNYHAACRARSQAEFVAKLGVVVEEADEIEHWLEIWRDAGVAAGPEFDWLLSESSELRAIFWASLRTARLNHACAKTRKQSER